MSHPTPLQRSTTVLALIGTLFGTAACAGPRVGEVIGGPSTTTSTVQARVLSSTPVVAQVGTPRDVCYDELRQEPVRSSGAGALMGAIAGGVIGNAVGKGAGRALTTGIGIMGGAVLGDHVENDGRQPNVRSVRRCEQQVSYENRVVAYNVVYEYAGQRYSTQTQQEPGSTIALQISMTPAGYGPVSQAGPAPYPYAQPGVHPAVVYVAPEAPVATVRYAPQWEYQGGGWWGAPRGHRHWD